MYDGKFNGISKAQYEINTKKLDSLITEKTKSMSKEDKDSLIIEMNNKLKNILGGMILQNEFWGYVFARLQRRFTFESMIAGVSPDRNGNINLTINPIYFSGMNEEDIKIIFEHEGMHIINLHLSRRWKLLELETDLKQKIFKTHIFNIAADMACNSQAKLSKTIKIFDISIPILHPQTYVDENNKQLEINHTTEVYYHKLLESEKEMLNNIKVIQCHSWGNEDGENNGKNGQGKEGELIDGSSMARKIEQSTKNLIADAKKTYSKQRGNIPGYLLELIDKMLDQPQLPYYEMIAKYVKGSKLSKYQRGYSTINKKRSWAFFITNNNVPIVSPFPGKKRDLTFKIVLFEDTSGSMSNDNIKEALSGLKYIVDKDRNVEMTVLEVDTEVKKEYRVKKISDIQFNIEGRGGTTLGPGLFRAKELNADITIVFTDGGTEDMNQYNRKDLPKKILWILTHDGYEESLKGTGPIVRLPR
jgi:predicted metal-dependent peptidase